MAQRVCVTGASGQAGRAVVADLRVLGFGPAHSWRNHVSV